MSTLLNNQPLNLATGTQDVGPLNLPNSLASLKITLARCTTPTPTVWPNSTTTIAVTLFVSLDGGTTWIPSGAFTAAGGIYVRNGVEVPSTIMEVAPIPDGTSRKLKATIVVNNGPLVSSVTIEAN